MSMDATDDNSKTAPAICIENDGYINPMNKPSGSAQETPSVPSTKLFTVIKRNTLFKDPDVVELTCYVPDVAASCMAGHFITVKPYASSKRIPFSISNYDPKAGSVSFTCSSANPTTSKIAAFAEGQSFAGIAGPLGHPADFDRHTDLGHVVIVANKTEIGSAYVYARTIRSFQGSHITAFIDARPEEQGIIAERLMSNINSIIYVDCESAAIDSKLVTSLEEFIKSTLTAPRTHKPITKVYTMGSIETIRAISNLTLHYGIKTVALMSTAAVDSAALLGSFRIDVHKASPYFSSIYEKFAQSGSNSHVPTFNIDEFARTNMNPEFPKAGTDTLYVYADGPEFDAHRISWGNFYMGTTLFSPAVILAETPGQKTHTRRTTKPSSTQTPMPMQNPRVRCHNWAETSLGYTPEMAIAEASRCLQCKKPMCVKGCPVQVPIPQFIKKITERDFLGAYRIVKMAHNCPSITGRVCPQENQCQSAEGNYGCILCRTGKEPVGIGKLERFVADYVREHNLEDESIMQGSKIPEIVLSGHSVAIIGSGPAGLAAARECALAGHKVTIFEALDQPGGVLNYGIPKFRLPKQIVAHEVSNIKRLGNVELRTNTVVGKDTTISKIKEEGYSAIFIGTGVGIPRSVGIPGENLPGVVTANDFLKKCNLEKDCVFPFINPKRDSSDVRSKVVVIGCGNVAMDCACSARRLGADVTIVYRRRLQDSPARLEEIEHAEEEGVQFATLNSPLEIVPNDTHTGIKGLKCQVNTFEAGEIVPLTGEFSFFACSMIIIAVGFGPNNIIVKTTKDFKINNRGLAVVDDNFESSVPGVFCAGDVQTGAATVIKALGNGAVAGQSMNFWIAQNHATLAKDEKLAGTVIVPSPCPPAEKTERPPQDIISPSSSVTSFTLNSDIEEVLTTNI